MDRFLVKNLRVEKPRGRSPITLLIDDPTPCINPIYYFASQVPKDAVDYHYTKKDGKWYFDSDSEFKHPIKETIDQKFVHEFAQWVEATDVAGKISVVPYPAGLGRVDQSLVGFPKSAVKDFVSTVRNEIMPKFDVGPEMLTHTRALNVSTGKLVEGISEHDWSQKQDSSILEKYIALAFRILKNAKLRPSGVTSPCNFGMYVEGEYAKAILQAAKKVLGIKAVWYFLQVDSESLKVDHRVVYLDREGAEAVVSLFASMNDPFWTSQLTDQDYQSWLNERVDPVLSKDGKQGRIIDQVQSGSFVTIITHWQSLYSNGTRYGLKGLAELVSRINQCLNDRIIWMRCGEIAQYLACSSSLSIRNRPHHDTTGEEGVVIDFSSPFDCKDFTFSFETGVTPRKIRLKNENQQVFAKLERVTSRDLLKPDSWFASECNRSATILVCLRKLSRSTEKVITYGVTKKTKQKVRKQEFHASVVVTN
jgi:hypothetical protein